MTHHVDGILTRLQQEVERFRRRHHELRCRNAHISALAANGGPTLTQQQSVELEAADAAYEMARQSLFRYYEAYGLEPPI